MEPKYLSEAEAQERDDRLRAAGITVVTDALSTITLLRKTTEEMLAEAKAAGVEVTVTQLPKGTGEIVPLPCIRRDTTKDERDA